MSSIGMPSGFDIERYLIKYGPAISTAAISWGNLPPTPKKVRAIQAKFGAPMQYLALFNMVYQGNAKLNVQMAAVVTAIFFMMNRFLDA